MKKELIIIENGFQFQTTCFILIVMIWTKAGSCLNITDSAGTQGKLFTTACVTNVGKNKKKYDERKEEAYLAGAKKTNRVISVSGNDHGAPFFLRLYHSWSGPWLYRRELPCLSDDRGKPVCITPPHLYNTGADGHPGAAESVPFTQDRGTVCLLFSWHTGKLENAAEWLKKQHTSKRHSTGSPTVC